MKKIVIITLALIIAVSAFASCSAKNNSGVSYDIAPSEGQYEPYPEADKTDGKTGERKLIKRYSVTSETKKYDDTAKKLDKAVSDYGGYFERRAETNIYSYDTRRLTATVRIPSDKSDEFLIVLRDISNVTSFEKAAEDVTGTYIDIEARLQTLEAEREGLLNMISSVDSAEQYDFWYKLHEAISEKEQDIAAYRAQLKNYDDLSSYSTFTINLTEVKEYTEPEKEGYGTRLGNAFKESWEKFAENFKDFTVSFVRGFPGLLTFTVISVAVFLAVFLPVRASIRRRRKTQNK